MSIIAYKLLSNARDAAPKGKSKSTAPPGTTAWADTLVGLVPAEAADSTDPGG